MRLASGTTVAPVARHSALRLVATAERRRFRSCLEATAPLRLAALNIALSLIVHSGRLGAVRWSAPGFEDT